MTDQDAEARLHRTETTFRDNSPDALYGSILALEAVLSALLVETVAIEADPADLLRTLRLNVETIYGRRKATKFGTGAGLIADGVQDTLDAIFRRAEAMLDSRMNCPLREHSQPIAPNASSK